MADAQDLKMKKWLFLLISSDCLTSDVSFVFTGEKSFFACPADVPLSKTKSGTKSGTRAQDFRSHTKNFWPL
jgi:hypothetical protein